MTTFLVSFCTASFAQDKFTLKGKIANWDDPAKIFIDYTTSRQHIIDSAILDNGKFEFHGEIDGSTVATLRLSPDGSSFDQPQYQYESSMILNPGLLEINGGDLKTATQNVTHKVKTEFKFSLGESDDGDNKKKVKYPRVYGGITFSRIDWGFSRLMDDGKFTLSEDNSFLSYKKASNFGFDVAQFGLRFNDNFKAYLSAGFEWNYLRFKENILLEEGAPSLSYETIDRNDVNYKKNVFTSTYLRAPVTMEWRSDKIHGDRVKIAFGMMTGVLLKGTQRLKSEQNGKQKFKDNYNLSTFQYGPFLRIGYDEIGLFAKYYVNDMFENSPAQEGLNNFAFGLTLGF
jgi:opacity protein-like surface antigen